MNQELVEAIKQAVEWLDSDQEEEAVLSPHGISLKKNIGHLAVSFAPVAASGKPVIVFDDDRKFDDSWPGFSVEDITEIREAVESIHPIEEVWNGLGYGTFSVMLDRFAGPGVFIAVQNYHDAGSAIFDDGWWSKQVRVSVPDGWH
jgi:hypothetical protein